MGEIAASSSGRQVTVKCLQAVSHGSYITKQLHNSTVLTLLYSLTIEYESVNDAIKRRSLVLSVLRALEPDTTELRHNSNT